MGLVVDILFKASTAKGEFNMLLTKVQNFEDESSKKETHRTSAYDLQYAAISGDNSIDESTPGDL